MRRILFVDDEPRVLRGFERMFSGRKRDWEMSFALSGAEALDILAKSPHDAVVSDVHMPGMDGVRLLTEVKKRFPGAVRIALSGYTDDEAVVRSIPMTHQFLLKPCRAEEIERIVQRACTLQDLLSSPELQAMVGQVGELPAQPECYAALCDALADDRASMASLADIVERDMAMSGRVLQLVNSAFVGLPRRVSDIQSAVTCVGTTMLKNLVLGIEVFRPLPNGVRELSIRDESDHAWVTAALAARMAETSTRILRDEAFVAALLHDIGKLVLAEGARGDYDDIVRAARDEERPLYDVEVAHWGVGHAEVGAYLLGVWGFPYAVVEAVAHHHHPARIQSEAFDLAVLVHAANVLAREAAQGLEQLPDVPAGLDLALVERVGMGQEIPTWRRAAAKFVADVTGR